MESIRLDALAAKQFAVPLEEAAALLMAGRVYIGHVPAGKPGEPVPPDTVLTLREKPRKYASRSGYKLEKALGAFGVDPTGRTACDLGASNGGFTDCLLQHGAARVCAVDVAYGILAWELRQDGRVTVLERTNARNLTAEQVGGPCDLVTADVSFISLTKIFPAVDRILKPDGQCLALIKPQFEAAPRQVGKNGVLRDPADLPPLLLSLLGAAEGNGLHPAGLTVSPIHGANGNVEYLAHFTRCPGLAPEEWPACVEQAVRERPDV
ncbi:MAG TPA: TlyA family RNA methyltransferase [Firmicutes bacterium]|nr:TlyA family RNA methyltransferase [Bacillota bacterium]